MNKKVWTTLLCLLIGALVVYNFTALVLPEQFIMCLTNTTILKIGEFIEANQVIVWIFNILTTGIIYYLWSVVANRTFKLKARQWIALPILMACTYGLGTLVPAMAYANNVNMMLVIFLISNKSYKPYILYFVIHTYSQFMILFVRGYEAALPILNIGSELCMWFESLVMALVFCILSVCFKKKDKAEQKKYNEEGANI